MNEMILTIKAKQESDSKKKKKKVKVLPKFSFPKKSSKYTIIRYLSHKRGNVGGPIIP